MRSRLLALILAAPLLGAAGCTAAEIAEPAETPTDDVVFDESRMGALPGLPACPDPLPPGTDDEVPTIPLPDGTVVTSVTRQGELVNLQGFIPNTPVQTRAFYANVEDATVLQSEDEGREAEILITTGPERVFVKAGAACDLGSSFIAVIAPDDAAGSVPTPAGTIPPNG